MAASVDTPSPIHLTKERKSLMSSSPLFSPSSDKRFWSNLSSRIDELLEIRKCEVVSNLDSSLLSQLSGKASDRAKRLKEDSLLLLRGFDSVADSLSQLSNNIDNALQGARDLAKQPTLTEIFNSNLINAENKEEEEEEEEDSENKESENNIKKILKRRFDSDVFSEKHEGENSSEKENEQQGPVDGNLKKAKIFAESMATKAASLTRELKLVKSDLYFVEERCALIQEENRRLRDGFNKGIGPEEDDLVRLQLEALLAEKSRLANENANLIRENQCLNQLVEYHQVTSLDLSASYEQVMGGLCLDFSSIPRTMPGEELEAEEEAHQTPRRNGFPLT